MSYFMQKSQPSLSKYTQGSNTERTFDVLLSTNQSKAKPINRNAIRFLTEPSMQTVQLNKAKSQRKLQIKKILIVDYIRKSYNIEIAKIQEECKLKFVDSRQHLIEMIKNNRDTLVIISAKLNKIYVLKTRRSLSVDFMNEILHLILKFRNIGMLFNKVLFQELKVMIYLSFAKLAIIYKLTHYAISLAKLAKRLSDSEYLLIFKMKSYAILSSCFLELKLPQAKVYTIKYLLCSWKLKQREHELKAYDQLGKFYYYEGNLEMAKLFHDKMVQGEWLPDNSSVKRVGISKLEQGSIGKARKDCASQRDDLNISSDDEPYEIIFNNDEDLPHQQMMKNIEIQRQLNQRKSILKWGLRKLPKFSIENDKNRYEQYLSGNLNIRQQKQSRELNRTSVDLNKIKGMSRKAILLGVKKDPVILNHLSPNRCLANYQYIELNRTPNGYKNVSEIEPIFDQKDLSHLSQQVNKLNSQINYIIDWLDDILIQI